jgi:hypothetical protein
LFTEKLKLSEPSDRKKEQGQDSSVKEAKQSKRGKRGGKNKDTPEERAKAEINKVIALKARLAKKKDRPYKIKAVIDHKAHNSGKTGKSKELCNAQSVSFAFGLALSTFSVILLFLAYFPFIRKETKLM